MRCRCHAGTRQSRQPLWGCGRGVAAGSEGNADPAQGQETACPPPPQGPVRPNHERRQAAAPAVTVHLKDVPHPADHAVPRPEGSKRFSQGIGTLEAEGDDGAKDADPGDDPEAPVRPCRSATPGRARRGRRSRPRPRRARGTVPFAPATGRYGHRSPQLSRRAFGRWSGCRPRTRPIRRWGGRHSTSRGSSGHGFPFGAPAASRSRECRCLPHREVPM
jgi:hypothetical protein